MLIFILFCIWLIFWSFSTVLIERWHSGKNGIMMGRSECPKCNTTLTSLDLVPIFSYIFNRWNCRHCKKHISIFYPIAELFMWSIFALLGYSAWQIGIDIFSMKMFLLLICGFTTGVYVLYDLKYMEIPDQIMIPVIGLLLAIPLFSLLFVSSSIHTFHMFDINIINWLTGAWILYTFFYIQILIPGGYYLIKNRDVKNLWDLLLNYITFPFLMFIDFFRKNKWDNSIEIPTWVGWWDLRIAIFVGLTLGTFHGIMSFAFAYILWSIVGICMILVHLIQRKKMNSQIPFGPFLAIGWFISVIFYSQIEYISNIFLY